MDQNHLFEKTAPIFRKVGTLRKIVRITALQSRNFVTRLLATPNNPRATAIPEIALILDFTTLLHKLAFRKLRQYRSVQNPGLTAPQIVHLNSYLVYSIITSLAQTHFHANTIIHYVHHTTNFSRLSHSPARTSFAANQFCLANMRAYACRVYLLSGIWAATSRSLVAGVRRVFKSMV